MKNYPRFSVERCVDTEAECLYRFVNGAEDVFYPHCHDFYEIFLTISGTVTHLVNGIEQKLPEGTLVFIRPDDVHGYIYNTSKSTKTSYLNLAFTRDTLTQLFLYLSDTFPGKKLLEYGMPPTVLLNSIEKQNLLARISELNIVNWQDKNALKLRMRSILADIFVRFFYNLPDSFEKTTPAWITSMLSEMELPENFVAGAERMSEISGRSREHIARSIRKYCGITTAEYINELRINYASNLLLRTNTPVLDICYLSGFESLSYFYKIFNQKYGISPGKFRKQSSN